jgi:alpha/beta hydrolase fold
MSKKVFKVETEDGINWHVEQSGSGSAPHILFVPSGEGDCHSFGKVAELLSTAFTVTTFDMPGFSRSIPAPHAFDNLSPYVIANQIVGLMDKLSIQTATIYGSSSGGVVATALLQEHADRVERIIGNEMPMTVLKNLKDWAVWPESENPKIVEICKPIFLNGMNENKEAWIGLGEEYHKRLEKNYVTWVRNYSPVVEKMRWGKEELTKVKGKINWSLGGQMPMAMFFDNVVLATELGIKIKLLDCKHFPYVSIPEVLAEYIKECCK